MLAMMPYIYIYVYIYIHIFDLRGINMDKYGQMGYIMLINYDKLIYSLTCGCCFAVFVMEHLGMGYPKSSTEPVSKTMQHL